MAQKRMFNKSIVDNEEFYELPVTSQLLYFHLGMHADVDGFVQPKKIIRIVGLKLEDLRPLVNNKFVILFDSGVVVITHWNVNNRTRKDRESPTIFTKEKILLTSKNGVYELSAGQVQDNSRSTPPKNRIEENRIEENRIEENRIEENRIEENRIEENRIEHIPNKKTSEPITSDEVNEIIEHFNLKFNAKYRVTSDRVKKIRLRLKNYTKEEIQKAIDNLSKSPFHTGENDRKWTANIDFIIRSDEKIDEFINLPEVKQIEKFISYRG